MRALLIAALMAAAMAGCAYRDQGGLGSDAAVLDDPGTNSMGSIPPDRGGRPGGTGPGGSTVGGTGSAPER